MKGALRVSFVLGIFALTLAVLPTASLAQNNLGTLPGQTRLQSQLGTAINTTICPTLGTTPGVSRDDGSEAGFLLGRCQDLVHTANEIQGSGPTTFSLGLTSEETNAALDSIAHTQMPAIGRGASEITILQAAAVSDRLYALREGGESVYVAGHAYTEDGRRVDFDYDPRYAAGAAGADDPMGGSGLGMFLNVEGGFGDRDSKAEELGFDYYNVGGVLGLDFRFTEQLVAGIAGGYTYADRDFDRSGGDIESDTGSGWVFAGFSEQGFYIDALYGFSYHWIDTDRTIAFGGASIDASGDTDATEHVVAGNLGYMLDLGGLGIGPVARIEYVRLDVDSFSESGAGGLELAYQDDDIDSLITNLGAEASFDISTGFGVITPQVGVEWAHQFEDDSRAITAQYKFDPTNTKFFVKTSSPDRNYLDVSASVAATFGGGFSTFVAYDTILGHSDLTAHQFTLGGRVEF